MTAAPYRLRFPQLDREIPANPDETLFQSARHHGVDSVPVRLQAEGPPDARHRAAEWRAG